MTVTVAHQRKIREAEAVNAPRAVMASLDGCFVREVSRQEATAVILRYEWLGTMPTVAFAYYGLETPAGELAGVVCFGYGGGTRGREICAGLSDVTICLERGACVHWAHPHAGSFLISRACRLMHRNYGWRIFYAYSDPMAGEIGTIYQACNWLFIGVAHRGGASPGRWRFKHLPTNIWYSTKQLRSRKTYIPGLRTDPDWLAEFVPDNKGRYVRFEGTHPQRKEAQASLRYRVLPYPKRV